ncbi:hypothetical protein Hanom_Chr11g01058041 [Helianthus anomalus]
MEVENIGQGREVPTTGDNASEKIKGQENEESDEDGGAGAALNDFGGNWREIFADCMGSEKSQEAQETRHRRNVENNEIGGNVDINETGRNEGIFTFQSMDRNLDGDNQSGPEENNVVTGKEDMPNQYGPRNNEEPSGPGDDPFNLNEIIWGQGNRNTVTKRTKRKKGRSSFTFTREGSSVNKRFRSENGAVDVRQAINEDALDSIDRTFDLNKEPAESVQAETEATVAMGKMIGIRISKSRQEILRVVREELESEGTL